MGVEPEEVIAWAYANRYVRELTCAERRQYSLEPGCDGAGNYPTRTPFLTSQPVPAATPLPARYFPSNRETTCRYCAVSA